LHAQLSRDLLAVAKFLVEIGFYDERMQTLITSYGIPARRMGGHAPPRWGHAP